MTYLLSLNITYYFFFFFFFLFLLLLLLLLLVLVLLLLWITYHALFIMQCLSLLCINYYYKVPVV